MTKKKERLAFEIPSAPTTVTVPIGRKQRGTGQA
jgi:hypothetical protein